jgi:hypothetical protein
MYTISFLLLFFFFEFRTVYRWGQAESRSRQNWYQCCLLALLSLARLSSNNYTDFLAVVLFYFTSFSAESSAGCPSNK